MELLIPEAMLHLHCIAAATASKSPTRSLPPVHLNDSISHIAMPGLAMGVECVLLVLAGPHDGRRRSSPIIGALIEHVATH
jgi:hypothetical protein